MVCSNCGMNNVMKARYCRDCGTPFSEEKRQEVYNDSIWGKLDKLLKFKDILDLSIITGNPIFRAVVIIVLLVLVGIRIYNNGAHLRFEGSSDYEIQYNEELNEYYLLTSLDAVEVDFYVPRQAEEVTLWTYTATADPTPELILETGSVITLLPSDDIAYYVVEAGYEQGSEELKFYLVEVE